VEKIDLKKLIAQKNQSLAKMIPNFLLAPLKSILHIKELNQNLEEFSEYKDLEFIRKVLEYFDISISIEGEEHISGDNRLLIVANHPLGGLDGMAIIDTVGQYRSEPRALVNDFLMSIGPLRNLFVPVNKHGSNRENLIIYQEVFNSDHTIIHFPAGLCSRKIKGQIVDLKWESSFVRLARESNRDIVPTYISGRNSNWFYNLSKVRNAFKIEFNIEMIWLVDEMFKQRGQTLTIRFGKPVLNTELQGNKQEIADEIRKMVYA
jgi:putative hemolysin